MRVSTMKLADFQVTTTDELINRLIWRAGDAEGAAQNFDERRMTKHAMKMRSDAMSYHTEAAALWARCEDITISEAYALAEPLIMVAADRAYRLISESVARRDAEQLA